MDYIKSKPYDTLPYHIQELGTFIPDDYADGSNDSDCDDLIRLMKKIEDESAVLGHFNWSWVDSDGYVESVTREMKVEYLFRTTSSYPTIALRDSSHGYTYYSFDPEMGLSIIEDVIDLFGIPEFEEFHAMPYKNRNLNQEYDLNRLLCLVRPFSGCVVGSSLYDTYGPCNQIRNSDDVLRDHIINLLVTWKLSSQRPEKISEYVFYKACMELKT
jgi:hypothetical protein